MGALTEDEKGGSEGGRELREMDLLARPKRAVSRWWLWSAPLTPGSCGSMEESRSQVHETFHLQPEPHSPRPLGLLRRASGPLPRFLPTPPKTFPAAASLSSSSSRQPSRCPRPRARPQPILLSPREKSPKYSPNPRPRAQSSALYPAPGCLQTLASTLNGLSSTQLPRAGGSARLWAGHALPG